MRIRGPSFLILRGISLVFVFLAALLLVYQMVQYSTSRAYYPPDMTIGGVPVGGLDPQAASQRLLQVYALPVEIHYGEAVIDLEPNVVGFQLNTEAMLAAADLQRTGSSFWKGYWDYLWNRSSPSSEIPLVASYSEDRLKVYLQNEVSTRYDTPPLAAQPIAGSYNFTAGVPGTQLDISSAIALIGNALESPDHRQVQLTSQNIAAGRPSIGTLQTLLTQIIDESGFDGLTDIYFYDLQSTETLHFGYENGEAVSVHPVDIAFTGASTIKIPIMVSVFQHAASHIDDALGSELNAMITTSSNTEADNLMKWLDENRGPLVVSETTARLGLEDTFINGFFYPGAGILQYFHTPANKRMDISTDPDDYVQTTPSDIGMLLEDIYMCAQNGGGALMAAFPGQINQAACQKMIQYLSGNKLGTMIQAGVPEGTVVAHKHGWDINLTQYSDAGIIYTPGGNYVLAIYVYNPGGGNWNVVSPLYAQLSRAIYNYFNLPSQ